MKTDKPLVSILLAVYNPNNAWFIELLQSLNTQTYENLELLIWDDFSTEPIEEDFISTYITAYDFSLFRGEKNIGSNRVFEELTRLGKGKYFSYCDQDDIWCNHKIETFVTILENTNSPLVCSDVFVINEDGNIIGDTIQSVHKRHQFYNNGNVAQRLVFKNFVMGCATLVNAEIARKALPFSNYIVHDHWLGIFSATMGTVEICSESLLYYRKHSKNQTGVLAGVKDKQTYYQIRLLEHKVRIDELSKRLQGVHTFDDFFDRYALWQDAKIRYFNKPNLHDLRIMIKYREFGLHQVLFEVLLHITPNCIFNYVVKLTQNGKL